MQFIYLLKSYQCFCLLCIEFYRETIKNFLIFVHYSDIDSVKHNLYSIGVSSDWYKSLYYVYSLQVRLHLPSVADTEPLDGLQISER